MFKKKNAVIYTVKKNKKCWVIFFYHKKMLG